MKPEFKIDLSEGTHTPLEAVPGLTAIGSQEGFHLENNLRPPIGIYNSSVQRINKRVVKCCNSLEKFFKTSNTEYLIKGKHVPCEDIIDGLELVLYAAAEHVDDLRSIVRWFFVDKKQYMASKSASVFRSQINNHKAFISAITNAIKHQQAEIRIYSSKWIHAGIRNSLHGYFIEGVNSGGVGPNKIFHDQDRQVFSITSLLWEVICFLLHSSRYLKSFLLDNTKFEPGADHIDSKGFLNAVVSVVRLPIYSFEEIHPFTNTRVIVSVDKKNYNLIDSKLYGAFSFRWKKSKDMIFLGDSISYVGDGVTNKFDLVLPKKMSHQHWD